MMVLYYFVILSSFCFMVKAHPDIGLSPAQMVARQGYPVQTHHVTTQQGYILELHRIPQENSSVVFLQHGLLSSSADWVMMGPATGLAYMLYDAGYDVWMGNCRGNTYSRKHILMNTAMPLYWQFSFHEMGVDDLPSMIDYVLSATGEEQVTYVGHSMGTTMYWVLASQKPEYNDKFRQVHALAPAAFLGHSSSYSAMKNLVGGIEALMILVGRNEFLPNSNFIKMMGRVACQDGAYTQATCANVFFQIFGEDSRQLNQTTLPVILSQTPAGASTKTLLHYTQQIDTGKFSLFDYGSAINLFTYRSFTPPEYDLSKVTAPVYLYYSDNDKMSRAKDVEMLYSRLTNCRNNTFIPGYNHIDFLWAMNVREKLYDDLLKVIADDEM